tara:strand:- start:232 stop:543 length:312 start_codon:yes stop_codon:yes gene_type:complete
MGRGQITQTTPPRVPGDRAPVLGADVDGRGAVGLLALDVELGGVLELLVRVADGRAVTAVVPRQGQGANRVSREQMRLVAEQAALICVLRFAAPRSRLLCFSS